MKIVDRAVFVCVPFDIPDTPKRTGAYTTAGDQEYVSDSKKGME